MNENFESNNEANLSGSNQSDELIARLAASDPAKAFDANSLNAIKVDEVIAKASNRQGSFRFATLRQKFTDARAIRPRLVLASSLSAVASVATFAVVGSLAVGGAFGSHNVSPLFSVAAGSTQTTNSESKIAGADLRPNADMGMMMPFVTYHYTAGSGLSNQGGSAHIYQIAAVNNPGDFLANLAKVLGVQGDVHKGVYSDLTTSPDETKMLDQIPGKSAVSMQTSGVGGWWFSKWSDASGVTCTSVDQKPGLNTTATPSVAPDAMPGAISGSTSGSSGAADPASGKAADSCTPNIPIHSDQPTKNEAIAEFNKIMAAAGYNFTNDEIDYYSDAYSTSINAQYHLSENGETIDTGLYFSAYWDQSGELISASGCAAKVSDAGSFDTISEVAAIDRANDSKWSSFIGYGMGVRNFSSVSDVPAAGAPVDAVATGSEPITPISATAEPVAPTPMPSAIEVDPMPTDNNIAPTPEVQEITVDKVAKVWMQITDSKGGVWLVLGYQLMSQGNTYTTVPAIAEGLIGF